MQNQVNIQNPQIKLNSLTYKNKRGQTTHCDYSGVPYHGIRHRIHQIEPSNGCNVTIGLYAHRQIGNGWRVLCVEHRHDENKISASYIYETYKTLGELLEDSENIAVNTGYLN